jgi:hypothetical protein
LTDHPSTTSNRIRTDAINRSITLKHGMPLGKR